MSDSQFNTELDGLVSGKAAAPSDDLTRFAADLYGKEHSMTMPSALKQQIAVNLGLGVTRSSGSAPLSTRGRRVAAAAPPLPTRRWPVAFMVILAVSLAFTGLLQLATRPDGGERFGLLSPAVPTVEVSVVGGNAPAIADWIEPISPLDCTIDSGALDQSVGVVELDYSAQPERVDAPYLVPDEVTRNELTDRVRGIRACLNTVGINAFWTERLSFEMNDRSFTTSDAGAQLKADQIVRGRALSDYYMTNLGVTKDAYVMHFQLGDSQVVGVQPGVHTVLNPDWIVQLEDGRVVVLLSVVVVATEDGVFLTDPGDVVAAGGAWVLIQVDGEWLIDELLPVCFGNTTECDEFWSMLPGAKLLDTPVSSPIATPSE